MTAGFSKFFLLFFTCATSLLLGRWWWFGASSGGKASNLLTSPTLSKAFLDGATGQLFSGVAVRQFPDDLRKYTAAGASPASAETAFDVGRGKGSRDDTDPRCRCRKWSVFTTIFPITEAIERTLGLGDNWCTVVVLDRKTPVPFSSTSSRYGRKDCGDKKQLHVLTVEDQLKMAKTVPFIADVPWNHFGRKNIGYLYAIQRGARMILDIDDDNELELASETTPPEIAGLPLPAAPEEAFVPEAKRTASNIFNPYPMMGSTNPAAWPRGLPMTHVTDPATYDRGREPAATPWSRVGVVQSLANQDPDVDAIYRLTQRQRQFSFDPQQEPISVPVGTLTPYNAQASLHFPHAYWGLLLPITVPGRVSDIWRSYIVQRLLWDTGLQIVFSAPFVKQIRNPHSYLRDMDAERDLYFKATALTIFLSKWVSRLPTLQGRIEQLMIALYERDYLGIEDVVAFQKWMDALRQLGYAFPSPTNTKT